MQFYTALKMLLGQHTTHSWAYMAFVLDESVGRSAATMLLRFKAVKSVFHPLKISAMLSWGRLYLLPLDDTLRVMNKQSSILFNSR